MSRSITQTASPDARTRSPETSIWPGYISFTVSWSLFSSTGSIGFRTSEQIATSGNGIGTRVFISSLRSASITLQASLKSWSSPSRKIWLSLSGGTLNESSNQSAVSNTRCAFAMKSGNLSTYRSPFPRHLLCDLVLDPMQLQLQVLQPLLLLLDPRPQANRDPDQLVRIVRQNLVPHLSNPLHSTQPLPSRSPGAGRRWIVVPAAPRR